MAQVEDRTMCLSGWDLRSSALLQLRSVRQLKRLPSEAAHGIDALTSLLEAFLRALRELLEAVAVRGLSPRPMSSSPEGFLKCSRACKTSSWMSAAA